MEVMEQPTSVPVPEASADKLTANTMCVSIKFGTFGNSKKGTLANARFTTGDSESKEPDLQLLSLSKQLLVSKELTDIGKFDNETRRLVRNIAFPAPLLRGGIYLVSVAQVQELRDILTDRAKQRVLLVEFAKHTYETRLAETLTRLGVQGNPLDYPSKEEFANTFKFAWQFVAWETPTKLKAISEAIFEEETIKAQGQLQSVAEECRMAMRAMLLKLIQHLRDRLTPGPDGKTKRLHTTTVENLQEWLSVFKLRDITNDTQLGELVEKARGVMTGVDRKMLSDENVRTKVGADLEEIAVSLDGMVTTGRAFTFVDDED